MDQPFQRQGAKFGRSLGRARPWWKHGVWNVVFTTKGLGFKLGYETKTIRNYIPYWTWRIGKPHLVYPRFCPNVWIIYLYEAGVFHGLMNQGRWLGKYSRPMEHLGIFVYIYIYGGFLKRWYPTNPWVFLLKMIILGCFGVPPFKETSIYLHIHIYRELLLGTLPASNVPPVI